MHARGETEEQRGAQRLVLRRSRDVVLLGQGAEELRELDRPYLLLLGASAAMTSARRFAPGRGDAAGAEPARRARARGRAPAVRPRRRSRWWSRLSRLLEFIGPASGTPQDVAEAILPPREGSGGLFRRDADPQPWHRGGKQLGGGMSLGVGATRDCLPPTDCRSRPLSGAAETPGDRPARCAWAEIHVQTNAKDRGKQYARE